MAGDFSTAMVAEPNDLMVMGSMDAPEAETDSLVQMLHGFEQYLGAILPTYLPGLMVPETGKKTFKTFLIKSDSLPQL